MEQWRPLTISNISVVDLPNVRHVFKMKAYAVVGISSHPFVGHNACATPVDDDGDTCPRWNIQMHFSLPDPLLQNDRLHLIFRFYCQRTLGDKYVGGVRIPVKHLFDQSRHCNTSRSALFAIKMPSGRDHGAVKFSHAFGMMVQASRPAAPSWEPLPPPPPQRELPLPPLREPPRPPEPLQKPAPRVIPQRKPPPPPPAAPHQKPPAPQWKPQPVLSRLRKPQTLLAPRQKPPPRPPPPQPRSSADIRVDLRVECTDAQEQQVGDEANTGVDDGSSPACEQDPADDDDENSCDPSSTYDDNNLDKEPQEPPAALWNPLPLLARLRKPLPLLAQRQKAPPPPRQSADIRVKMRVECEHTQEEQAEDEDYDEANSGVGDESSPAWEQENDGDENCCDSSIAYYREF